MGDIQIVVYTDSDGEYIVRAAQNPNRKWRIRSNAERKKKPNTKVKIFSLNEPGFSKLSRSLEELFEFAVFINGHGREGGQTHQIDDLIALGVMIGLRYKNER